MNDNTYDLLIKYYQAHVTHRRHVFHFFIITSGALLAGLALNFEKPSIFATYAFFGILITLFFRALDTITYTKIRRSEYLLTEETTINSKVSAFLFSRNSILSDNFITALVAYSTLTIFTTAFLLTTLEHSNVNNLHLKFTLEHFTTIKMLISVASFLSAVAIEGYRNKGLSEQ